MRYKELIEAKKKKVIVQTTPYEIAYDSLMNEKDRGVEFANRFSKNYQLFVPRKIKRYHTKKEREDSLLGNKYAWDDEGKLLPYYQKWVNNINESAPILTNTLSLPGDNKPAHTFWTSTAIKMLNGTYTSDWQNFAFGTYDSKKIGYLYKVKLNSCILELDSEYEIHNIYNIFKDLERGNTAIDNEEEYNNTIFNYSYEDKKSQIMTKDFPWQEISKHFDAVHHYHFRSYTSSGSFFNGWDVESSAWFNTSSLELLGQVPILQDIYDRNDVDRSAW